MKTIAVTIDEATIEALDAFAAAGGRRRRGARRPGRSEIVRRALQEFLARQQRAELEARERRIFADRREQLAKQAAALIAEQAAR
jgi:metal-responsive CopG/Arc/MetJ family transcriptional regulator